MGRVLSVPTINGPVRETVYSIDELSYLGKMLGCKESVKNEFRNGKNKKIHYLEIPAAFDIETTTICKYRPDGSIDSDAFRPYAYMYQWQFCLDDEVCFGRTWEEFQKLLDNLSIRMNLSYDNRLVIWVHNLAFEFQFFRRFVTVQDAFCKDVHKPIRVLLNNGIEFRCSYALSNMSLQKFCENERDVIHYKLSGEDYNYSRIRTQLTPLSDIELAYCYNDVRGLCECIRSRMHDDTLARMPMTSTGYVRRMFRSAMSKEKDNRFILQQGILTPELYLMLRDAFRGGDCHANIRYVNQTLIRIQSFDIASSYPSVLMTEKYPMGKWTKMSRKRFAAEYDAMREEYCFLVHVKYTDIRYKDICGNPYISSSKCLHYSADAIMDNGRIGYASSLDMVLTDIDLDIIQDEYEYTNRQVKTVYCCLKDYLPEEFRATLRKLFEQKTQLKGVKGKEYEYNKSKSRINSAYGMTVQRIDNDLWKYTDGEYEVESRPLEEQLQKYYKSRNSFLRYEWGVWCTAYARQRLRMGLQAVGRHAVYCDTDSVKCDGYFGWTFDRLNECLKARAEAAGAYADDRNGNRKYMGIFEYEGTYDEFRTLGAKKYVYRMGDDIISTIAGVAKDRGSAFFKQRGLEALRDGETIPESGHLVAYYNDDEIHTITVDHCEMVTGSSIALCNDTYTIGVSNEYGDLMQKAIENIEELYYTD